MLYWHSEAVAPAVKTPTLSGCGVDKWWVVDTGCGQDLVQRPKAMKLSQHMEAALSVSLDTGGGKVDTYQTLKCAMKIGGFIARVRA